MWQNFNYTKVYKLVDMLIFRNLLRIVIKLAMSWVSFNLLLSKLTSDKVKAGRKSFVVVNDLLSKDDCNLLIDIIDRETPSTVEHTINFKNLSYFEWLWITLKSNSLYYYDFPEKHFSDYKFIYNAYYSHPEVRLIVDQIVAKIKDTLGFNFRIDVIDLYKTNIIDTMNHENSKYHLDGEHKSSARVLIYLNDVLSKHDGPLCIKDSEEKVILGESGTGVFFFPARDMHKGLPPLSIPRYCLNLKMYPSILSSRCSVKTNQMINRTTKLFGF